MNFLFAAKVPVSDAKGGSSASQKQSIFKKTHAAKVESSESRKKKLHSFMNTRHGTQPPRQRNGSINNNLL